MVGQAHDVLVKPETAERAPHSFTLHYDATPEVDRKIFLRNRTVPLHTVSIKKTKTPKVLLKKTSFFVLDEYVPPSEKAWRHHNKQYSDPNTMTNPSPSLRGTDEAGAVNLLGRVCVGQGDGEHAGVLLCCEVPVEVRQPR